MQAAVVRSFSQAPTYETHADPLPGADETLIKVSAAALSQLVKSQAAGRHYSSDGRFPFIPGVDGVGRRCDGTRVYFAFPAKPFGAMAELVAIPHKLCVRLPAEVDDIVAAAIANPGMSSWAALNERAHFKAGETVLINGATGVSGRLAIQIAKYLGAKKVLVTGRNRASLEGLDQLGADIAIPLDQRPEDLVHVLRDHIQNQNVGVILDYLWGPSAESLIAAIAGHGADDGEPRLRYVQIGSLAGATIAMPGAALRSSGLELMGSGLGSVSKGDLVRSIGELMLAVGSSKLKVEVDPRPLREVEKAWNKDSDGRVVFTM